MTALFLALACAASQGNSSDPGLAAQAQDKDDPQAELRSFKVAEGFEVNLFASEKQGIVKPLQIRWDPQGRLWVTCGPSYPQLRPGEEANDSLIVLEDTKGAGHADRSRVFARGLSTPMGLEIGRGGVFVGSGGEIVHFKDPGSEGRAPEKTVLLRGFFTGDSHQNINSFVWGPSGELLFCQGLHATARIETPWGVEKLEKAGVWRLRDRALRLDPFLGYDMGPQNPYGIVFDDWAQPIMVAGNGQGIYYLLPAQIRSTHFLQYAQIWDRTNKLAGADILSGAHIPEDLHGVMVCGGFLNNAVFWFRLLEDGAGFRAKDLPALIVSSHPSFRPVDVRVGPDGAIYVADWYNPIIGHYQASFRHPDRDKTHGRIWRIAAKNRAPVKQPNLVAMSVPELLEQLRSNERWTRYQARRLLSDREASEVLESTKKWIDGVDANDALRERLLIDALGLFESYDVVESALLKEMLHARNYRVRAFAARAISLWNDRLPDALDLLAEAAADEHPRVRLEAIVASSYLHHSKALEAAAIAVDRPMDRFLTYALTQAVHALKPQWKPAFDRGELTFGNKAERLQFVLKADGTSDVVQSLLSLMRREDISKEVQGNALALLSAVGGPAEIAMVLKHPALEKNPELAARILDEVLASTRVRRVIPLGEWTGTLREWVKGPLRPRAIALAGLWRVEGLRKEIESAEEMEAIADLGGPESIAFLSERARAGRTDAIVALTRLNLKVAAMAASRRLAKGAAASEVEALVRSFLNRQGGQEALAEALGDRSPPADAAKLGLRTMSAAGRQDAALFAALSKAAGVSSAAPEYDAEYVKKLGQEALSEGDPARGETVFRGALTNCFSCHAIGGAGGKVGPDLSAVGTGLPVDMVVESVLWPNRQVKEGYSSTAVVTRDDVIIQGFKVNEDKQTLVLRDPNREQLIRIAISDIKARKEIGSVMPEGLANGLTRAELRDLIRFLCDLGKPGPFRVPDRPLVRRWEVMEGPERWSPRFSTVKGELPVGDMPVAKEIGKAMVRFEVDVLTAGRFRIEFNSSKGVAFIRPGGPVAASLDLSKGRHSLVVSVDASLRDGEGLQCLLEPAPGSAGEARLNP